MKIIVYGTVQGVGFRPAVHRLAREMGLDGYVHNMGSCVEICVNGDGKAFLKELKKRLPPLAQIDRHEFKEGEPEGDGFRIVRSSIGDLSSLIPPDTAVCDSCVEELKEGRNRRYRYAFINCTDCGARYSVIRGVPFDRERTAMAQFPRCARCKREYLTLRDRRFHAQTSSCPACGPRYGLYSEEGKVMRVADVFTVFALHIDQGDVGIMKTWGGAHAVCTVEHSERLRKLYDRPRKPLAVMVRDMEHAERYAVLDKRSRELLSSPRRPIVLVPKKKGEEGKEEWLEDVAPGLDRVGLYLPYTGVQHLLFESLVADAVVMTSANLSGSPMATTNKECLRLPGEVYLLHNRQIVNRTDDSLVLPNKRGFFFLRKSRGYVPSYLPIPHDHSLVAIGGDMNGCGCVASGGRALATQYIGDVGNYDASVFLGKAMTGLMKLSGLSPKDVEGVVVDMHPRYSSRRVGQSLAAQWGVPVLEMQHHAAHLYSLMGEHSKESMVALTCDGTGYGTDDTIWGGEVLSSFSSVSERLARLRPIPMLGGERAVEEPTRLAAAACWLLDMEQPFFKEEEAGVLRKMLGRSVVTSSAGRFLDLVSSWLGICTEMTYDGEPAMRLERYLAKGRQRYKFDVDTRTVNGLLEVDTLDVLRQLADVQPPLAPGAKITEGKKANLAVSTVRPVFEALVDIAASAAEEKGTGEVGFTGGVSYNLVLDRIVEKQLKKHGLRILRHKLVPNGDGGVSYGQAVWAGGRDG